MAVTLKDETILNQWTMLVMSGAGRMDEVYDAIEAKLAASSIPGKCTWEREEVQTGGMLSRVRREFLIVRTNDFEDYRTYIGIRDYGAHLSCCRFITVEPGFLKRELSKAITGGEDRMFSAPKNILVEQDLAAWAAVVHRCVIDAVKELVTELGQDPGGVRTTTKGMLEVW